MLTLVIWFGKMEGRDHHMLTLVIWFGRMEGRDHHIFTNNWIWEDGVQRHLLWSQFGFVQFSFVWLRTKAIHMFTSNLVLGGWWAEAIHMFTNNLVLGGWWAEAIHMFTIWLGMECRGDSYCKPIFYWWLFIFRLLSSWTFLRQFTFADSNTLLCNNNIQYVCIDIFVAIYFC